MAMMIKWKTFLIPYSQAVDELKVKIRNIRKEYRKKNEYSPIEFVTGRVKEISSILEKAKKLNLTLDEIDSFMEDIAGIRIMCQFVDDIERVAELIRQRQDMLVINEKDYIDNVKESGYRSYHMIIKYPINLAEGKKEILAEIQIRTLAMNFWATIEHSLNYKYKHDIPIEIRNKLKNAADAAFQLDGQMLEIKDEIKDAQKLFEVKSNLISDIVNNILVLSSMNKLSEVSYYKSRLNKLLEEGDEFELSNLLDSIEKSIYEFRKY
ncbi:RelA/SpoT domain-containing protein [Clostridium pasteurianum DSM 525 = ATCC 6013]|uniref:RelA/SpoT domain protein n=1 Tax=Clostridium pasteurianum DSM 525 = ATCC 6013 TaxID=1262449 RepID=A0A0H3J651_CLOPA|nr:GTP pyrophosphokinase family protein [Clostridium pasteurianum]AJA47383.1 RelA/SpoT domain-containing protein [Clostridium pasteurianum DSM 525 = ATCC 6013]AJA51371.1 RelA/SpoT domain-containing protein [Clostridium pasteurianum DSM 525 = ATCC 6013]ELP58719.1 GTP pyrophosphokinase [Clostridium pasteurianum DSM 525 = ATCC 6013]KRU12622.1 RelA/SpoT domain protein [Clostridium pasteurianum DSM 525 = ATCC 6013]